MEVEHLELPKEKIIEDVDEENEVDSEDHGLDTIPKCSNRYKGKGILVDDEIAEDVTKQVSAMINKAYVHNPNW